jgi:ubiquinol-cytochrome c reductase iron-sulfur subunit
LSDIEEIRTPVSVTGLDSNDIHMQPAANNPQLVERVIAVNFFVGIVLIIAFGACFWINAQPWKLGATLGGGMFFLGVGLIAWGKYLMPRGPFVEERHSLANTQSDRDAFAAAIVERGGDVIKRRKLLGGLLGGGLGIFSVVALFPVLRSLGPLPKSTLDHTDWAKGSYVVDQSGRRVQVGDLAVGSITTVFPEGTQDSDRGQAVNQTVLIRLCTHLGCPVGLYEQQLQLLVCPCHQSTFNVNNGAIPQFGPAPRPLPQLPLYIDASGYLRSQSDFHTPVGPGFWERH